MPAPVEKQGYVNPNPVTDPLLRALASLQRRQPFGLAELTGRRIVMLCLGGIGDVTFTLPVIRALRSQARPAEILYISSAGGIKFIRQTGLVEETLSATWVEDIFPKSCLLSTRFWKEFAQFKKILRAFHADIFISFNPTMSLAGTLKYALIAAMAAAPLRVGFDTAGRAFFLNYPVRDAGHLFRPDVRRMWDIAEAMGLKGPTPSNACPYDTHDEAVADAFLKAASLEKKPFLFGLHPGGGRFPNHPVWKHRRWGIENFAALADAISARYGGGGIVFAGPGEEDIARQVAARARTPLAIEPGKTSFREFTALVDKLDLFVANDGGLMHLAAGTRAAVIGIFGFSDRFRHTPWGENNGVACLQLPCSPCVWWFEKKQCPETQLKCLRHLTVEMLMAAIENALKQQDRNSDSQNTL